MANTRPRQNPSAESVSAHGIAASNVCSSVCASSGSTCCAHAVIVAGLRFSRPNNFAKLSAQFFAAGPRRGGGGGGAGRASAGAEEAACACTVLLLFVLVFLLVFVVILS